LSISNLTVKLLVTTIDKYVYFQAKTTIFIIQLTGNKFWSSDYHWAIFT